MKKILICSLGLMALLNVNAQTDPPVAPPTPTPVTTAPTQPAAAQPVTTTPAAVTAPTPPAKPASATTPPESKWRFGLNIAPSLKWLSTNTDGVKTDGSKIGFSYGFIAEYYISSSSSFCTGMDFTYRGGAIKSTDTMKLKYSANLQYFEIPLVIKMHTADVKNKSFYAKFGLAPGWYIGHKGDNIEGGINTFYTAMKIGGGMDIAVSGSTRIFAGIIWNNGFIDAAKSDNLEMKNQCIALEIGVLF